MDWNEFEEFKVTGKSAVIARISNKQLFINRALIDEGFDVNKEYILLFNSQAKVIGLRPTAGGEVHAKRCVTDIKNNRRSFYIAALLNHYQITGKYAFTEVTKVDGVWLFDLSKAEVL